MRFSCCLALCALLVGCAAPETIMINKQGKQMRCASFGFGWLGTPIALAQHHDCVEKLKQQGYRDLDEAKKYEGPKVESVSNSIFAEAIGPSLKVGDEWTYRTSGAAIGTATLRLEEEGRHQDREVYVFTRSGQSASLNKDGNKIMVDYSTRIITDKNLSRIQTEVRVPSKNFFVKTDTTPPFKIYEWPIKVGKKWQSSFSTKSSNGKELTFDINVAVKSYGKITVPAGTFEVFYLTAEADFSGVKLHEIWYSPKVKSFVKRIDYLDAGRLIFELKDYKLASK